MKKNCRVCKIEFEPTEHQIKKGDIICKSCRHEYDKKWRIKRKVLGLPCRGSEMPREYFKEYNKTYKQRPDVKAREAAYMRKYRQDPVLRDRHHARRLTQSAIEKGILIKGPCSKCGKSKAEAHHKDYLKPLMVVWLCRDCHREVHGIRRRKEQIDRRHGL